MNVPAIVLVAALGLCAATLVAGTASAAPCSVGTETVDCEAHVAGCDVTLGVVTYGEIGVPVSGDVDC